MDEFVRSMVLLFVLLNPFMMSVYLVDLIQELDAKTFSRVLIRGTVISFIVFVIFAWLGDVIFRDILQARFASFLLFGGVVFLIIGLRFVFSGSETLRSLRGKPEHLGGSIAMPFIIGPGSVSASVLAGSRMDKIPAAASIAAALFLMVTSLMLVKRIHDFVRQRNERLVERYLDIMGRAMALVIGTFAVEMILQGIESWLGALRMER